MWATYVQPRVFGQVKCDERWISQHYDLESDFYLLFLDKPPRCYSHGYFRRDDEPLEAAIQRKLDTAITACGMRPGMRVLDIGAGWGAFTAHAGRQGIQVTSLTISAESERYVRDLIAREHLPCQVLLEHFLEHTTDEPYDAIVNLGVTEHLPDYAATLAQYRRLPRTSGRATPPRCTWPPTSRRLARAHSRCCTSKTTVAASCSQPSTGPRTSTELATKWSAAGANTSTGDSGSTCGDVSTTSTPGPSPPTDSCCNCQPNPEVVPPRRIDPCRSHQSSPIAAFQPADRDATREDVSVGQNGPPRRTTTTVALLASGIGHCWSPRPRRRGPAVTTSVACAVATRSPSWLVNCTSTWPIWRPRLRTTPSNRSRPPRTVRW